MHFDWTIAWHRLNEMLAGFFAALPGMVIGAFVLVAFVVASRWAAATARRLTALRVHGDAAAIVMARLAQWAVVLLGVLVALAIAVPTFHPGNVVEVLGVGSVAIGFAFRDVLQNFLAGILLLVLQPFRIGDEIVVEGYEGTVDEIQTRATLIRTYDGRRVVIPNATLFTETVTVNTAFPHRRLEYDVGVGYGDDPERARTLILEAMRSVPSVLRAPAPDALVMELGESSVAIRARWWIEPPRRKAALDARDEVLTAIKRTLSTHGIDLPFPTRQILFHDQTEEGDGDRTRQREGWPAGDRPPPRARGIAAVLAPVVAGSHGNADGERSHEEPAGVRASRQP